MINPLSYTNLYKTASFEYSNTETDLSTTPTPSFDSLTDVQIRIGKRVSVDIKVAGNTFEKCEKNGFEHDIVDYYRVLKGKEYHSGMQK